MIFMTGYQKWPIELFAQKVAALDRPTIIDIRLKPWSNHPEWCRPSLMERFPGEYIHEDRLGNVNYKSGGPIQLKDEWAGLNRLEDLSKEGDLVLLCACWSEKTCHRSVVAEGLRARGIPVVELTRPPKAKPDGGQQTLLLF